MSIQIDYYNINIAEYEPFLENTTLNLDFCMKNIINEKND
jgi:hypothetical protein